MPVATGWELLAVKRVNGIMQELRDQRELPQDLRFLNRTPVVNATDGEIMGRFRGDVLISDIITEGATAIVKNTDRFSTETYKMPKIKHGVSIDEEMIALLNRINAGGGIPGDNGIISNYIIRKQDALLLGVRQRWNAMLVAMRLDTFNYSRGGVVIRNASWGMPSDLKAVPGTYWNDPSATPFQDTLTLKEHAQQVYGKVYDRLTMSTWMLRNMIATDEFKSQMQLYYVVAFPAGTFPGIQSLKTLQTMAEGLLGMTIELEDSVYWDQAANGAVYSVPFYPRNVVELSSTADDNNASAAFLGNAIVPETIVSSLADVGGVIGRFEGPEYGPISYTVASPTLNPPDLTIWAAAKSWPVKNDLAMTARITATPA